MLHGVIFGISNLFNLFSFLIILRIFLTWIPSIRWEVQPWSTLRAIVDPYLEIFRRIVPPFANLDFSPIIALLVLQLIANIIIYLLFMIH